MTDAPLSPELQRLVDEEEALLKRTLAALESARQRARTALSVPLLAEELAALKEEAATANPADLPHLFNQMDLLRPVVDRAGARALVNGASPYFAHLRVNGPAGVRDYLLGRETFTDAAADVRIIDWRTAPLARVFYNYQEGDDYEETFGDRLTHGDVLMRRLVVIERGVLTGIRRGRVSLEKLQDGRWVDASSQLVLGGGAGTAVRSGSLGIGKGAGRSRGFDITAQLDPSQYAAMNVAVDQPLLVLGSAGSGKTTVALHRMALLAARELASVPRTRLQVVVPEEGLARLSRRLLEPLGLGKVPVKTASHWAVDTARAVFREKELKGFDDAPPLVTRLKRHPALAPALKKHPAVARKSSSLSFAALRRRVAEAFSDRIFLKGVVEASGGELPSTAIEETVHHTMLQMASSFEADVSGFDSESTTTIDGKGLDEGTPEALAGTIDIEDFPILMALKAEREELDVESTKHLVLDEAEDFSVFELFVLGRLLSEERSCTVAGDEMQQTTSSFPGWPSLLETLGVPGAEQVRLKVSYRCPPPIAELARHVLGSQAAGLETTAHAREAAPVGFHHFPSFDQASLFLRDALQDLLEREPRASVAVIASSSDAADTFFAGLSGLGRVRRVVEGQYTFEPGVDVTDADEVKGLEWDYVVLPDVTARGYPVDDESRRRLHVAVTRAAHQLWVLSYDLRSRLLPR